MANNKFYYYIYRITNKVNNHTYIGQHKCWSNKIDRYFGSGTLLIKAINKYGKENFEKEIIYTNIQNKDTADSVEMFAIAKERKLGKAEYNICKGGQGGSPKGRTFSIETRAKMSLAAKKRKHKPFSEEAKRKMSEAAKGKHKNKSGFHWYTNGIEEICCLMCPDGFTRGRLKRNEVLTYGK